MVGWICALPIELRAAVEMLDEEHPSLPREDHGSTSYTLGRIGNHNVVLACLPANERGPVSTAAVATLMKSKFVSIQFSLMVGIGSGVPSGKSDVRLGDVVISNPGSWHGGVVQFDSGEIGPGELFTRTGTLNAPSDVLLSALSKLKADRLRGKSNLLVYLSAVSHLPDFARSSGWPDLLFEATYGHVEPDSHSCDGCDKSRVIERAPRESQEIIVHYGMIASGNRVIKDGTTRDRISSDLGGALCFDMEAAGLMNYIPSLIIRGICDYADSHENHRWQPYAAVVAAACAKELLSKITYS